MPLVTLTIFFFWFFLSLKKKKKDPQKKLWKILKSLSCKTSFFFPPSIIWLKIQSETFCLCTSNYVEIHLPPKLKAQQNSFTVSWLSCVLQTFVTFILYCQSLTSSCSKKIAMELLLEIDHFMYSWRMCA